MTELVEKRREKKYDKIEKRDEFHLLVKEREQQGGRRRGHKEGRLKREQFPAPT